MVAIVSDYGLRLEDVDKYIMRIADRSTPLLKRHLSMGSPATAIKHEWGDKALKGLADTLAAAITSTTQTIITVNGGTNTPKRYIGGITQILIGGERMLVGSVITTVTNSATLWIGSANRGYHSSTASTFAVNTQVKLLNSRTEGFTTGRDDSQKGVRNFNYTMIFERQLSLSRSSQAVDVVENENVLDRQADELTAELLKELEGALVYSDRNASTDFTDRSAGGFYWQASQLGGLNFVDKGTNAISFSDLDTVIEKYLKNGGEANQINCLTSVRQQRKLDQLKEVRIVGGGMNQSEKQINNFVETYQFGAANIDVFFSTDVRDDEMYFYQKDKVKVIPLKGQAWKRQALAKTGDTDDEFIVGEYTFEFRNTRETLFMLYNLDTQVN